MADQQYAIALQLYPQAEKIEFLASGEVSDVYVVDDTYTVRFPRSDEKRAALGYETEILSRLDGVLDIPIPRVIEVAPDGAYETAHFIVGDIYGGQQIATLEEAPMQRVATSLALFMRQLNDTLDVAEVERIQTELAPDYESYAHYYDDMTHQAQQYPSPAGEKFLACMDHVRGHLAQSGVPEIIVHGDLHAGNLVFRNDVLTGILDFGDVGPGTIYDELRPIYSSGERLMRMLIAQLDPRFGSVDIDMLHYLAVAHEVSVLIRSNSSDKRRHVARTLLQAWGEYDEVEGI